MSLSNQELVEQLQWRYAVKKFDATRKLAPEQWSSLAQSLVLSPSSYGLQPWRFIVVQSPELRKKLTPFSRGQTQVEDCSQLVVFTVKEKMDPEHVQRHMENIAGTRNAPVSSMDAYKERILGSVEMAVAKGYVREWSARQCYIALGNFMTAAAVIGVDTCPMEGIEPAKYDEILNLRGTGYATLVACAAGFRASDDKYQFAKKVRFDLSEVLMEV